MIATHATPADIITFAGAALMVIAGALGVVSMRNPVHAALSLVLTLFGIALLFIEQQADFLAAVQIIVYAGAIVVLFLFVIMFLGIDREENVLEEPLAGQRPMAYLVVLVAATGVLILLARAHWVTGAHGVARTTRGVNVAQIGRSVFTTYLFAFEATAALLVIAVVGAVVLARRPAQPAEDDPDPDAMPPITGEAAPGAEPEDETQAEPELGTDRATQLEPESQPEEVST